MGVGKYEISFIGDVKREGRVIWDTLRSHNLSVISVDYDNIKLNEKFETSDLVCVHYCGKNCKGKEIFCNRENKGKICIIAEDYGINWEHIKKCKPNFYLFEPVTPDIFQDVIRIVDSGQLNAQIITNISQPDQILKNSNCDELHFEFIGDFLESLDNSQKLSNSERYSYKTHLEIVEYIKSDKPTQEELNKVIEHCFKTARFFVRLNMSKIAELRSVEDLNIDDLAIDSISGLFVRNEKKGILNIKSSLESWKDNIKCDKDASYFLYKLVEMSVNQYVNKILKEHNPMFSKLLDSLNYQIRVGNYKKVRNIGKTYVVEREKNESIYYLAEEELEYLLQENNQLNHAYILQYLFKTIEDYNNPAIPVNHLIYILTRKINNSIDWKSFNHSHTSSKVHIDQIIELSLAKISTEITKYYVVKNRLSLKEGEMLLGTLKYLSEEMKNGIKVNGIKKYFLHLNPGVSCEVYSEKYHNILEYLFKKFRRFLIASMKS